MESTKRETSSRNETEDHAEGILHCKCRIVKLIRGQMARLDKNKQLEGNIRSRLHMWKFNHK